MKKMIAILVFILFAGTAAAFPVVYNTKNGTYHDPSCSAAHACTKSCITIDSSEAIRRGGHKCGIAADKINQRN